MSKEGSRERIVVIEDEPEIERRCLHPAYEGLRPMDPDATRLAAWEAGAQVVSAVGRSAGEVGWFKRTCSRAFYRVFNRLSEAPAAPDEIVIDQRRLEDLAGQFERVWQRPPTRAIVDAEAARPSSIPKFFFNLVNVSLEQ